VRVLITGASGFVGGALSAHLSRLGYQVTGLSRRAAMGAIQHDLSQPLPESLGTYDAIVHCAALSSPWASPAAFQVNNVDATRNMLRFSSQSGCRRFVFISSSSVYYRHGDQFDLQESSALPAQPINEYAATKRQAENLVLESPLSTIVLRPRAVFGPGDTVLFPRLLRAAAKGAMALFTRPDGLTPRGDLIYIDNLSHFIERAIASMHNGCFNLTNSEPVDLYAFLNRVFTSLGLPRVCRRIPVSLGFATAGALEFASRTLFNWREPPITRFGVEVLSYSKTLDVTKANAAFGPPPISVDEGVERFVAWQKRQPV
jgi:nucleoside-diphosphate-sugar epimerase